MEILQTQGSVLLPYLLNLSGLSVDGHVVKMDFNG